MESVKICCMWCIWELRWPLFTQHCLIRTFPLLGPSGEGRCTFFGGSTSVFVSWMQCFTHFVHARWCHVLLMLLISVFFFTVNCLEVLEYASLDTCSLLACSYVKITKTDGSGSHQFDLGWFSVQNLLPLLPCETYRVRCHFVRLFTGASFFAHFKKHNPMPCPIKSIIAAMHPPLSFFLSLTLSLSLSFILALAWLECTFLHACKCMFGDRSVNVPSNVYLSSCVSCVSCFTWSLITGRSEAVTGKCQGGEKQVFACSVGGASTR